MKRFSRYSIVKLFFEKRILEFPFFSVNSWVWEKAAQPPLQNYGIKEKFEGSD